ncbi:hypothetical protein [Vreelandella indica]|uniref:hypothetical protein n=1 Tax=Vreelandella indica TaxID=3126500 RepID=UPI00300E5A6F
MLKDKLIEIVRLSVKEYGAEKTLKLLSEEIKKESSIFRTIKCLGCKSEISISDSYGLTAAYLKCKSCRENHIFFIGACRTSRKSGSRGFKKLSIRYFDGLKNQQLFEVVTRGWGGESFEIKSKDNFYVLISRPADDNKVRYDISIYNETTGREYILDNSTVYNIKNQFPGLEG